MAQIIKIKGNKTNANATPSSLVERELASNLVDRCLFGSDGTSVFKYYTGSTKYFDANGYANNANKLGGQTIDYFASADGVADALDEIIDSLKGYQPLITSTNKLAYSLISGVPTKLSQFTNDLGLGTFAYKSSLAFADLTNKPTTLSGFGITDAYTKSQVDSALGGYLPLSGGTINGDIYFDYKLNQYTRIFFKDSRIYSGGYADEFIIFSDGDNKNVGSLGLYGDSIGVQYYYIGHNSYNGLNLRIYKNSVNWGENVLIHSGNYTDYTYSKSTIDTKLGGYLPLSGGTLSSYNFNTLHINSNDSSTKRSAIVFTYNKVTKTQIGWDEYQGMGSYLYNYASRVFFGIKDDGTPYYYNGTYNTIIHSGNIGSQNVASAAKLTTARTIWGQSFDGTGNVSGNLILGESSLRVSNSTTSYNALYLNSTNGLYFGYETSETYNTLLWGKSILFVTGTNGQTRLYIKNDGNVGIGTASPQEKLDIMGTLRINRLGSTAEYLNIVVGDVDVNYRGYDNSDGYVRHNFYSNDNLLAQFDGSSNIATFIGRVNAATMYATTGIWSDGYVSAKGQNTSSDMRLKNVLNEVVLGVKDIANAPAVRFAWKNGGGVDVGSSAQYWQGLLPDAVKERDGMLEMQYANIALLSAIAIAKNVETHEERIARLEKENKELRNEINSLRYGA